MPSFARNDADLYYEVHGEPTGPTLVLLHGVGGNHASWFHQVTEWRHRFRIVVPDARGFGRSTDPQRSGRDDFVGDFEALFDHAGIDRAVLVGQSMGGGTAISFACRHPEKVRALVLADTLFGIALPESVRADMAALTARMATASQQERVLGPRFRAASPHLATLYTALASFNVANVRTLTGTQAAHTPAEIAATRIPILFLVGQEDALFPPSAVRAVHLATAGSAYVELDGVGHSGYIEAPDRFNSAIAEWLTTAGVELP
jgi:3-oxoadipate enol-lactonase